MTSIEALRVESNICNHVTQLTWLWLTHQDRPKSVRFENETTLKRYGQGLVDH